MQEKLHFYYTNDLHSNFTYWSRVAAFLKEKKSALDGTCWLADTGDHIDRVDPIAEASMGQANVRMLNELGYDVVTLGNNEGITLSHEELRNLYVDADFQVVCANLKSKTGRNPAWLQHTYQVTSEQGLKISFIGLTAPFNAFYELLDWHVDYPQETLENHILKMKETSDIIILLSHLGINEDREIARRFPEIDVIIGGHTHHLLRTGEHVNQTVITAAGKHCAYVGEVILTWDHERGKLINQEAYTTNITHLQPDPETETLVESLSAEADNILRKRIIKTISPIEVEWFRSTPVIEKLTSTLRDWTDADCALLNAGMLLESLPSGNITYKDVHRICPHPINPCTVRLTGDELMEVIRVSFTKELMELPLKGLGFRGKVIGKMIFSGLTVTTRDGGNGEIYVQEVKKDGRALDRDMVYTVATADMFTFGRLLPEIAKATTKQYYLPEFIRDLLVETLQHEFAS